jgi:aminoglycoside 6'-N-acetyltransferase I
MRVRAYEARDRGEWMRMRALLWPDEMLDDADADDWLAGRGNAVLVAERDGGGLCGFAEVGERSVVDGCLTSPVGYLEGWWVDADVRRRGVGTALVRAFEAWARARGYRELGSDVLIDNEVSQRAHGRLGFQEVSRVVTYRKDLSPSA